MVWVSGARFRSLVLAGILLGGAGGCSSGNSFQGRLFLINTSGQTLMEPAVINAHPGVEQKVRFADLPDGHAVGRDFGRDQAIAVLGDLKLSQLDKTGETRVRSVPFRGVISEGSGDDFFIEVGPNDRLESGRLVRQRGRGNFYTTIVTHILAAVAGMGFMWLFWRDTRNSARGAGPEKPLPDPELG